MVAQFPGAVWLAAAAGNYTAGRTANVDRVVIHITDGPATRAVQTARYFANHVTGISPHFVVGRAGSIFQCVHVEDRAHHAGPANNRSVGIEHVVPHNLNPKTITHDQYVASAGLVRWLCTRFHLPVNRTTIIGHVEADPGTGHQACPELAWDWNEYQHYLDWGPMIADLAAGRIQGPQQAVP